MRGGKPLRMAASGSSGQSLAECPLSTLRLYVALATDMPPDPIHK